MKKWQLLTSMLLLGCGEPEPSPQPAPAPTVEQAPPAPAEPPVRDVVVGRGRFPAEVMQLQPGDMVEVNLTKGGRARGRVEALKPDQLALATEGTAVITRLAPPDVATVRLVHRPQAIEYLDGSERPKDERESWLPRFAGHLALEGDPDAMWTGRFAKSYPVIVNVDHELPQVFTPTGRMGQKVLLTPAGPFALEPNDQLKLVAQIPAAERKGQLAGKELGLAQVWLHRRGDLVGRIVTTEGLPIGPLDPETLNRLKEGEPSTLVVAHPGKPREVVRVVRAGLPSIKEWRTRLEKVPDRPGMRRLRAQRAPELPAAEKELRTIAKQWGAEGGVALGRPLVFELIYPSVVDGKLQLVTWTRELGLD